MNPKLIGITGGIGSGKSTVSEIFKHLGYKIYNSDLRAKELIKEPDIKNKLVNAFGDKILKNDTLDKEQTTGPLAMDQIEDAAGIGY